jgi:hypothetical protein
MRPPKSLALGGPPPRAGSWPRLALGAGQKARRPSWLSKDFQPALFMRRHPPAPSPLASTPALRPPLHCVPSLELRPPALALRPPPACLPFPASSSRPPLRRVHPCTAPAPACLRPRVPRHRSAPALPALPSCLRGRSRHRESNRNSTTEREARPQGVIDPKTAGSRAADAREPGDAAPGPPPLPAGPPPAIRRRSGPWRFATPARAATNLAASSLYGGRGRAAGDLSMPAIDKSPPARPRQAPRAAVNRRTLIRGRPKAFFNRLHQSPRRTAHRQVGVPAADLGESAGSCGCSRCPWGSGVAGAPWGAAPGAPPRARARVRAREGARGRAP